MDSPLLHGSLGMKLYFTGEGRNMDSPLLHGSLGMKLYFTGEGRNMDSLLLHGSLGMNCTSQGREGTWTLHSYMGAWE